MVPGAGLEPARRYRRGILNPLCLPISPPGLWITRLEVEAPTGFEPELYGFAIRCIAILPQRHDTSSE